MKGIAGLLLTAAVVALVGGIVLGAGLLEREMARAQQDVVTQPNGAPATTFETAERYYEYGSHVPWIGSGPLNDVRAKKAALTYWQGDYASVVPQQSDPVSAVPSDNVAAQMVVANALFRVGQMQAKDRQSMLQALDAGINAYAEVLKNADRAEDAAYNYEYLVRLRDDVDKGRRKPGSDAVMKGPEGAIGSPPKIDSSMSDFKIYIPLESQERQENGVAGKAAPGKRKG